MVQSLPCIHLGSLKFDFLQRDVCFVGYMQVLTPAYLRPFTERNETELTFPCAQVGRVPEEQ